MANERTNLNSGSGGLVTVTIANPAVDVSPDAQPVKTCRVRHFSGTATFMNIDAAAVAASSWPLSTTIHEVAIDDLSTLHFIGTAGDIVQIMWFN